MGVRGSDGGRSFSYYIVRKEWGSGLQLPPLEKIGYRHSGSRDQQVGNGGGGDKRGSQKEEKKKKRKKKKKKTKKKKKKKKKQKTKKKIKKKKKKKKKQKKKNQGQRLCAKVPGREEKEGSLSAMFPWLAEDLATYARSGTYHMDNDDARGGGRLWPSSR